MSKSKKKDKSKKIVDAGPIEEAAPPSQEPGGQQAEDPAPKSD